jgi:DNA polymerase III alpha subunit
MTSLCRMCNVHDIDTLVAIVSVIRPGAANEDKKREFTRRYQGLSPVTYAHPSLEAVLRSTFGLVVYEEHILQVCDVFAGMPGGEADVLRRALVKEQWPRVAELRREFFACAERRGRTLAETERVWELVAGFHGYAFCKAHSAAYGVEAYQAAWLKRNFPAEFLAGVLTNGKGFYRPLVYVLECWRLEIALLPPWVNEPGAGFRVVERPRGFADPARLKTGPLAIRVPVEQIGSLTAVTKRRLVEERGRGRFGSLGDLFQRVQPTREELEILSRAGALDGFGLSRCEQFWEIQTLWARAGSGRRSGQPWLLAPGTGRGLATEAAGGSGSRLPNSLVEPSRRQRLAWETELLGFPASGHPLELHADVAWDTYCPVARLGEFAGQEVTLCGLVIEDRVHHQVTGEPMKFLTLCDWTGMVETELFAQSYRHYGLATVRYPVLEVTGRVERFENGRGHTLRVLRAGKPRRLGGEEGGEIAKS